MSPPKIIVEQVYSDPKDMAEPRWGAQNEDVRNSKWVMILPPNQESCKYLTREVGLLWDEKPLLYYLR